MNFWKIKVVPAKKCDYNVFYKNEKDLTDAEVLYHAVNDKDLIDCHVESVENIEKISSEEYYNYMFE